VHSAVEKGGVRTISPRGEDGQPSGSSRCPSHDLPPAHTLQWSRLFSATALQITRFGMSMAAAVLLVLCDTPHAYGFLGQKA